MENFQGFYSGQPVDVVSDDSVVMSGIITKMGSRHAEVVGDDGRVSEVDYGMLREAIVKTAQRNRIKEEEKDGQKFFLDKEEKNVDGKMSVRYKVTVDGKEVWSSEELVTNVYDNEYGWSAPDDFDDGKLDLMQKTAENGFELLVDSFKNITELATKPDAGAKGTPAPEGKPAFAPGSPGAEGADAGPSPEGMPETTGVEGETVSDTGVPVEETTKVAPEIPAEAETAEPVATAASLNPFSRRIVSDKKVSLNKEARVTSTVKGLISYTIAGTDYEFDYTATIYSQEDHRADDVELELVDVMPEDVLEQYWDKDDEIKEVALDDAYTQMAKGASKIEAKGDQRLHNNPEHRLNPILRDEMKRRNIDSGNTNDLELADKLKDFDWSKKGSKKTVEFAVAEPKLEEFTEYYDKIYVILQNSGMTGDAILELMDNNYPSLEKGFDENTDPKVVSEEIQKGELVV